MPSPSLRQLRWGDVAPVPDVDTTANLTTAASQVLGPDPNRVQAILVNPSANVVRVRWGNEAPTTTVGIPIPENGGTLVMSYEEDGERLFMPLRGIASAATTIYVTTDRMPAKARKVA